MSSGIQRLRRRLMGVSDSEVTRFSRGDSLKWRHLRRAARTAVEGYHLVLDDHRLDRLIPRLNAVELDWRGYAYDGAAMGLTGVDCFLPGSRFADFVRGPAEDHAYMAHIGAGEALARLRRQPEPFLKRLEHPVLRWLVMDGYGFHEGFFRPDRHVIAQKVPPFLGQSARRVFDQGLGRAVWFLTGADVADISGILDVFEEHRKPDLWLGVGVACGYVGGIDESEIRELQKHSGQYRVQLAVGSAFVAKGRIRAGNLTNDTDLAARELCGRSASDVADLVESGFAAVAGSRTDFAYGELQQCLADWLAPALTTSIGRRP